MYSFLWELELRNASFCLACAYVRHDVCFPTGNPSRGYVADMFVEGRFCSHRGLPRLDSHGRSLGGNISLRLGTRGFSRESRRLDGTVAVFFLRDRGYGMWDAACEKLESETCCAIAAGRVYDQKTPLCRRGQDPSAGGEFV